MLQRENLAGSLFKVAIICLLLTQSLLLEWFFFTGFLIAGSIAFALYSHRESKKNIKLSDDMIHTSKLASIGQLAAGVGHEINNPLTIVMGNLEIMTALIEQQPVAVDRLGSLIDRQFRACQRIADIVNNLRMFARIDDNVSSFSVHESIQEVIHMLSRILKVSHIDLVIDFSADCSLVYGQTGRFQQVIVNLIGNAKDATEDLQDPKITVRTYNDDGYVVIEVIDNGPGIDSEHVDKIFQPFYTTKGRQKGTGLGLGISHSIVDDLGGNLTLMENSTSGACFQVKLPYVDAVESAPEVVIENEVSIEGKVLIVEDESEIRDILAGYLREVGFELKLCANAEEALEVFAQYDFDLVLTDMKMGKISGVDLIEIVKVDGFKGRTVLMTGEDYKCDPLRVSPDAILLKPFTRNSVIDCIVLNLINHVKEDAA